MIAYFSLCWVAFVGVTFGAVGDEVTVYGKDGLSFQGAILSESDDAVTFDVVYDHVTLRRTEIDRMVPLGAAEARPSTSSPRPAKLAAVRTAATGTQVGDRPPAFETTDLNGTTHIMPSSHARVTVLHFWATWCPHCRTCIPKLRALASRYRPDQLQLMAISDESEETLRKFVEDNELPYPVIASKELPHTYGLEDSVPVTLVIDRHDIICYRQNGEGDGFVRAIAEAMR